MKHIILIIAVLLFLSVNFMKATQAQEPRGGGPCLFGQYITGFGTGTTNWEAEAAACAQATNNCTGPGLNGIADTCVVIDGGTYGWNLRWAQVRMCCHAREN